MKILARTSIALLMIVLPFISYTQVEDYPEPPTVDLGIPTGPSILPANDIEIINFDQDYSVSFNLSTDGKDWHQFVLTGNDSSEYEFEGEGFVIISVCTGNLSNCRYYKLVKGKRYAAYRDETREVWDISSLKF